MSRRPDEPVWLTVPHAIILHAETIGLFGGRRGLQSKGLLESAIARPQQLFNYRKRTTVFELAAAYCYGLCRNHPFIDGNKRTGVLLVRSFLFLNGFTFVPDEIETVSIIEMVASDEISEIDFAKWIQQSCRPHR